MNPNDCWTPPLPLSPLVVVLHQPWIAAARHHTCSAASLAHLDTTTTLVQSHHKSKPRWHQSHCSKPTSTAPPPSTHLISQAGATGALPLALAAALAAALARGFGGIPETLARCSCDDEPTPAPDAAVTAAAVGVLVLALLLLLWGVGAAGKLCCAADRLTGQMLRRHIR
jgi:hypothetical protein